jgi:hypothetical protein
VIVPTEKSAVASSSHSRAEKAQIVENSDNDMEKDSESSDLKETTLTRESTVVHDAQERMSTTSPSRHGDLDVLCLPEHSSKLGVSPAQVSPAQVSPAQRKHLQRRAADLHPIGDRLGEIKDMVESGFIFIAQCIESLNQKVEELHDKNVQLELLVKRSITMAMGTPKHVLDLIKLRFRTDMVLSGCPWDDSVVELSKVIPIWIEEARKDDESFVFIDPKGLDMKDIRKKIQTERASITQLIRQKALSHEDWFADLVVRKSATREPLLPSSAQGQHSDHASNEMSVDTASGAHLLIVTYLFPIYVIENFDVTDTRFVHVKYFFAESLNGQPRDINITEAHIRDFLGEIPTPRRLFGVQAWNDFVLNLLANVSLMDREVLCNNDEVQVNFEAFIVLTLYWLLRGQAIPKNTKVVREHYSNLLAYVRLDRIFGGTFEHFEPESRRWLKSDGSFHELSGSRTDDHIRRTFEQVTASRKRRRSAAVGNGSGSEDDLGSHVPAGGRSSLSSAAADDDDHQAQTDTRSANKNMFINLLKESQKYSKKS